MAKEAVFTLKLEAELRDVFMVEAEATHRPASQLVREFMHDFLAQREVREHDTWFRLKVQEALDDPRPGIAHDRVMDDTRAVIDRIAAGKIKE